MTTRLPRWLAVAHTCTHDQGVAVHLYDEFGELGAQAAPGEVTVTGDDWTSTVREAVHALATQTSGTVCAGCSHASLTQSAHQHTGIRAELTNLMSELGGSSRSSSPSSERSSSPARPSPRPRPSVNRTSIRRTPPP